MRVHELANAATRRFDIAAVTSIADALQPVFRRESEIL
jgi:hypothetical protein